MFVYCRCTLQEDTEGVAPFSGACGEQKVSLLQFSRYYRLATTAAHELAHK